MMRVDPAAFVHIKTLREDLAQKQDRVRDELAAVGNDPKRLSPLKRSSFSDCGLALRLIDDLEAQIFAGAIDDVPGTIGHLIALLKQVQIAALPGNATPVHGSPVTGHPVLTARSTAKSSPAKGSASR